MIPYFTRLKLRGAIPAIMPSAVPTLYLGMPPLEITGVTHAVTVTTPSIGGVGVGGVKVYSESSRKTTNKKRRQPAVGRKTNVTRANPTSKVSGRGSRKRTLRRPKNGSKNTSSSKKGLRVITSKSGRKIYMKNGKFIKTPKGG